MRLTHCSNCGKETCGCDPNFHWVHRKGSVTDVPNLLVADKEEDITCSACKRSPVPAFFCVPCGTQPCTGECAKPCKHGITKQEFCDDCYFEAGGE